MPIPLPKDIVVQEAYPAGKYADNTRTKQEADSGIHKDPRISFS